MTRLRAGLPNLATIVVFAMIFGVAVSVLVSERRDFTAALEKKGESLADFMAKVAPASILTHDITMLYRYVEEVAKDEEIIYAAIVSADGHVLAEFHDPEARPTTERLDILNPIVLGGQPYGHVKIGLTKALVNERINRESMAVFVVTFLGVAFAYWRLNLAKRELEQEVKNRTKELEAFVYTISHDLRSPVVSINGISAIILEDYGGQVDENGRRYIRRLLDNATYMDNLIAGLLALSRIGRQEVSPEQAAVRSVLDEVRNVLQDELARKNVTVTVDPEFPDFVFSRPCLNHIFQNLMTNAVKFMGNQPNPRIEIGGRLTPDGAEFFVKDNGVGIASQDHQSVFKIFHRLEAAAAAEGTGVGLAIVKKTVEVHGGRIWIKSEKGKGATFFVHLPRKSERRWWWWRHTSPPASRAA